jgi:hypothetical protein
MLISLRKLGILIPFFFLFSCVSSPDIVETKSETSQPAASQANTVEKKQEWVNVTVDEYFVSQETIQYGDGFIDGYRLYEYDDDGRILKQSHIGSDESLISEEQFFYEEGLLVNSEYLTGGELISLSLYSYGKNKELVEEVFMSPAGIVQGSSSFEYDNSGRKTKWISNDSGGIPLMYTEYDYEGSVLNRMRYFLPTGEMEGYTQLDYKDSRLVKEASYSAASKLEKKTEYQYKGDQLISALFYFGKNLSRTVEYSYDVNGNVREEKNLNRNGDVIDIISKEYIMIPVSKQVLK